MAGSFPLPREAANRGVVCSFLVAWYPVEKEERRILGVRNSMRRGSVELVNKHEGVRTGAVVKA